MDRSRLLEQVARAAAATAPEAAAAAEIRALLGHGDVAAIRQHLQNFAELVEDSGPLAFVRFDGEAFAAAVQAALPALQQRDPEALCDALHQQCIAALATPAFIEGLRQQLQQFVRLGFTPRADRLAACTAYLTTAAAPEAHGLTCAELPALYAVFRAQLVAWLHEAGRQQQALAGLACALQPD